MEISEIKKWYEEQEWFRKHEQKYKSCPSFVKEGITIALLVANDVEFKYLINLVKPLKNEENICRHLHGSDGYFMGVLGVNDVLIVKPEKIGMEAATNALNYLLKKYKTIKYIISVGVIAGININCEENLDFGDVIVSSKIARYGDIKVSPGNQWKTRGTIDKINQDFITKFTSFDIEFNSIVGRNPNVVSGCVLSGPILLNDPKTKEILSKEYKDAIGLEMEGGVNVIVDEDKKFVIIKGICDWGENKVDVYQPLAAHTASLLVRKVLSEFYFTQSNIENNNKVNINSLKIAFLFESLKWSYEDACDRCNIEISDLNEIMSIDLNESSYGKENFPFVSLCFLKRLTNALSQPCLDKGISFSEEEMLATGIHDFKWRDVSAYIKFTESKINIPEHIKKFLLKTKAIVFDFDGTLTRHQVCQSTWEEMWNELGYNINDCRKLANKFYTKEISHQQWCDETCKKFREKSCTMRHVKNVASRIPLVKGSKTLIKNINKRGIYVFLLSGSIDRLIEEVLNKNCIKDCFTDIKSNKFVMRKNKLDKIIGTRYDFENKPDFIKEIIDTYNILPSQILFVGNSHNDEYVYMSGCQTLCINPHNTDVYNTTKWHHYIEKASTVLGIEEYISIDK